MATAALHYAMLLTQSRRTSAQPKRDVIPNMLFARKSTTIPVLVLSHAEVPQVFTVCIMLLKTDSKHQKNIIKYFRQVEELYTRFVDTDQIRLVKEAIDFVEAKTFSVPEESVKKANSTFYGAYASGVNVYISNHWDEDYTYCATSLHQKKQYLESQNVVAYFTFPRLGIAIPLRPGDVLFFNPKEPYCISSRCDNRDDNYCVSLYLKSANIGKNDNNTPLTPCQLSLLDQYNEK